MEKRHYSPEELSHVTHSLEKEEERKLREAGSTSKLATPKPTILDDSETIGPYYYRRRDVIGDGYSSQVYRARCTLDNDYHAVKVIDLRKFTASSLEMLDNEIRILNQMKHPNVITLENVYRSASHCYLITEYCGGGDLLNFMTKAGRMQEEQALAIAAEVTEGVKYMLERGIIHRDIKPANIFRAKDTWKIGDFGFAIKSSIETKTRHNVGTPLYMSLQALTRNIYSPESDIFAVGIILYEMMVGITPWECSSEKELIKRMSNLPFHLPEKYQVSKGTRHMLGRLCAISREERLGKDEFMELDVLGLNKSMSEDTKKSSPKRKSRLFSVGGREQSKSKPKEVQRKARKTEDEYHLKKKSSSKKSITKTQGPQSSSKKKIVDAKVYGNSRGRSRSNSAHQKDPQKRGQPHSGQKLPCEEHNYMVLIGQLSLCRFMYYMVQNMGYFQLSHLSRCRLSLLLFKHILKLAKQLADHKHNNFQLKDWEGFTHTHKYRSTFKTLREYCNKYQKEYLVFLKKAEINVIKEVNQKLPEFSTNDPFTISFYQKMMSFIAPFIREFNHNLSMLNWEAKSARGDDASARVEGLLSLLKYYTLLEMNVKEYQDYAYFAHYSQIKILKNYRQSQAGAKDYPQLRQQIKMI